MQIVAGLGALVLTAGLALPTVFMTEAKADTGPPLGDMEQIEASLAYKKPNAPKQPQKQKVAPPPEVKPEGVSHDEKKDPLPKKPDDEKKPVKKSDTPVDPLDKFKRQVSDDDDIGKPNETVGAFDGSQFGIGDVTKGDPFFQRLVVDLAWASPELAKAGAVAPVGCIHMTADGKIPETKFQVKGDDDIATLAESALKDLKQKRNEHPEEVPTHLLKQLTTKWVCFKFTVKQSE